MNKKLVVGLLLVAVTIYSYNAFLLFRGAFPGMRKTITAATTGINGSLERMLLAAAPVVFEVKGRDPFTLYKEQPKPPPKKLRLASAKERKGIEPPPITITGILWNPDNPVATIKLPGGKTKLAKTGQQLDGNLTIKRIEKKSIIVVYEGKEFTINRR